jgi:hypothetical protein
MMDLTGRVMFERLALPLLSGLLLFALSAPLTAADNIGQTVGSAYDLESDELLYRETHCVSDDDLARDVIYQDAEGKLIARKKLDYSSGATTPSFVQQNFYSGELIEVALDEGVLSMAVVDANSGEALKSSEENPSQELPVVIDAGFDVFVRQNWDSLVAGESLTFQFPLSDRGSLIELRIQPLGCSYPTQSDQCFRLDVANWLLRMLVKPIELGYDSDQRQLTRFRGLSNIGDENGNGLVVDIKYEYQDVPLQACEIIDQPLTNKSAPNLTALLARRL